MSRSLARAAGASRLNSPDGAMDPRLDAVAPRCAKASIGLNGQDSPIAIALDDDPLSLVFETVAAIGMSEKEAAISMGLDPSTLSRVKSGQARLPWDALWRMPDRFWLLFARRVTEAKGVTPADATRVRRARMRELLLLAFDEAAS